MLVGAHLDWSANASSFCRANSGAQSERLKMFSRAALGSRSCHDYRADQFSTEEIPATFWRPSDNSTSISEDGIRNATRPFWPEISRDPISQ